jgi:hypothetical protein
MPATAPELRELLWLTLSSGELLTDMASALAISEVPKIAAFRCKVWVNAPDATASASFWDISLNIASASAYTLSARSSVVSVVATTLKDVAKMLIPARDRRLEAGATSLLRYWTLNSEAPIEVAVAFTTALWLMAFGVEVLRDFIVILDRNLASWERRVG